MNENKSPESKDAAFKILVKGDILKSVSLAIQFNLINDLFEELIKNANHTTDGVNVLIERIDYIDDCSMILK